VSVWIGNCSIRLTQQLEGDTPQVHARKSNIRKQTNDEKNVRIASVVMPVMIAMPLLFGGSSRVRASDQPSTASVAIKIDDFVFGPQAITVPVGTTVT